LRPASNPIPAFRLYLLGNRSFSEQAKQKNAQKDNRCNQGYISIVWNQKIAQEIKKQISL